jgi:hypothetical protein
MEVNHSEPYSVLLVVISSCRQANLSDLDNYSEDDEMEIEEFEEQAWC